MFIKVTSEVLNVSLISGIKTTKSVIDSDRIPVAIVHVLIVLCLEKFNLR